MKKEWRRQSPRDTQTQSPSFPVTLQHCLRNSANLHLSLSHSAYFPRTFCSLSFKMVKFPLFPFLESKCENSKEREGVDQFQ